jgi:ABC-type cobalamin/Fe3+-siderophores transport system ATPase subunit
LTTLELTDDIKRIFNFEELEINSSHDDQSLQLFINRKVYSLSELGSGLAQFILVLVNVAIQKPSYILIDEPELNLHPSLQLDFLTTLGRYATEGTLFATHSIGLARSSTENIYTVKKTPRGSEVKPYDKNPGLLELLGELSYSTYREFGFEKILLVEGRTDIKTFQQFLRKYRQDQHILILSLGVKDFINEHSIEELREIQRISDQIYILIDSEKNSPSAELEQCRQKFKQNCDMNGIHCHILERRATENYFTDRAIKSLKGDSYSALDNYQLLGNSSLGWHKSENWLIAKEMNKEELESTDLGEFIRTICE